jgi:hypothetical protein
MRFKVVFMPALIGFCLTLGSASEGNARKLKSDTKLANEQMRERIISCISPIVPKGARLEGCVVLEIRVDVQGRVEKIRRMSGHPLLVSPVIGTVSEWHFKSSDRPVIGELALCYKNGWDIECKDHKKNQEKH